MEPSSSAAFAAIGEPQRRQEELAALHRKSTSFNEVAYAPPLSPATMSIHPAARSSGMQTQRQASPASPFGYGNNHHHGGKPSLAGFDPFLSEQQAPAQPAPASTTASPSLLSSSSHSFFGGHRPGLSIDTDADAGAGRGDMAGLRSKSDHLSRHRAGLSIDTRPAKSDRNIVDTTPKSSPAGTATNNTENQFSFASSPSSPSSPS